jgi:hypothetical protein
MVPNALVFMEFVFGVRKAIWDMDSAALNRCPPDTRSAIWGDRMFREKLDVGRRGVIGGCNVILFVLQFEKAGIIRFAQSPCGPKNCIENRLQLVW